MIDGVSSSFVRPSSSQRLELDFSRRPSNSSLSAVRESGQFLEAQAAQRHCPGLFGKNFRRERGHRASMLLLGKNAEVSTPSPPSWSFSRCPEVKRAVDSVPCAQGNFSKRRDGRNPRLCFVASKTPVTVARQETAATHWLCCAWGRFRQLELVAVKILYPGPETSARPPCQRVFELDRSVHARSEVRSWPSLNL
jgi:hypothetical protein